MTEHSTAELPDLFRFEGGQRVRTVADWRRRRQELLDIILDIEYGRLPPAPSAVYAEELLHEPAAQLPGARHVRHRLTMPTDRALGFALDLLVPPGGGPFPVVLNGDACWGFPANEIVHEVLGRGYALAVFNRVEIVPDQDEPLRISGLYSVYPHGDYGALAAWAWGYHRCVDFLQTRGDVDATRIAITGHSRGGKAVLLAGATDERIALTAPNDSGCCGAGCFRYQGPGSETLADIVRRFPYWFGPRLSEFVGREQSLPFDQHSLKALVAPRPLLSTEALGDLWANPTGTWQTHLAAREVYRFLGAEERIGIWYRQGGHNHGPADWSALLDYADWQLRGLAPRTRFDVDPFGGLSAAYSWSAPAPQYPKG